MRGRAQRESWRRTSRDLHRLVSRDGRRWVQEVWEATNALAREGAALHPLAAAVGAGIAETGGASGAPAEEQDEVHRARLAVIRIGCATRSVLASSTEQPSADQVWSGFASRLDPESAATEVAAVRELVDKVRAISETDFRSSIALPDEIWAAYVVTGTRELQRTLAGGAISLRELSRERVDELLRCGYLIGCLDEAVQSAGRARRDAP